MHNIRKIKKKKKTSKPINSEDLAQEKLFQISKYEDEEEVVSQADLFAERLKPIQFNPQIRRPLKSKFWRQQQHLTTFVNNLERKSRLQPHFISYNELRSHSSEFAEKKAISIINYMVVDGRQGKKKVDGKRRVESLNLKRRLSPRRNKSQEAVSSNSTQYVSMKNNQRQNLMDLMRSKNNNAASITIKNAKFFTKYPCFPKQEKS